MQDTESELNAAQRVELCRCRHTRGNHRWHAIGGKRPCYHETDGVRCDCAAFVAATTTEATYTDQQIRDAYEREYEEGDVDSGMLATMLDQQQREIERLGAKLSRLRSILDWNYTAVYDLKADLKAIHDE